jgi:hypothetical protein
MVSATLDGKALLGAVERERIPTLSLFSSELACRALPVSFTEKVLILARIRAQLGGLLRHENAAKKGDLSDAEPDQQRKTLALRIEDLQALWNSDALRRELAEITG